MTKPLLMAEGLGFRYGSGGPPVLAGVSLQINSGETLALLGANGSGKSTLLRLLLGLTQPQSGSITLAGRPLPAWSRREIARHIAYVPQSQAAPFPYRVRDLVALGRIAHRGLYASMTRADHQAVAAAMERLDITPLAHRIFTELSGGQRQLCLIARALAQEAPLIVMDEPITGLDYGNQWRLLALVRELAAEGRAFIKSTHHPEHALGAATRVILLHRGRLAADGTPEAVVTPANIRCLYGIEVSLQPTPAGPLALIPELARRPEFPNPYLRTPIKESP